MFFVLCEEEKVASFFFGCGAPFLADVSYFVTFEFFETKGGGKAAKICLSEKCKNG